VTQVAITLDELKSAALSAGADCQPPRGMTRPGRDVPADHAGPSLGAVTLGNLPSQNVDDINSTSDAGLSATATRLDSRSVLNDAGEAVASAPFCVSGLPDNIRCCGHRLVFLRIEAACKFSGHALLRCDHFGLIDCCVTGSALIGGRLPALPRMLLAEHANFSQS